MTTTTATVKGQVTIPAELRRKLHIRRGTRIKVMEEDGRIILEPLPDDLLQRGRGALGSRGEAIKALLADRATERQR